MKKSHWTKHFIENYKRGLPTGNTVTKLDCSFQRNLREISKRQLDELNEHKPDELMKLLEIFALT